MYIPDFEILKRLVSSLRNAPSPPDMPRSRDKRGYPEMKETNLPKWLKVFY